MMQAQKLITPLVAALVIGACGKGSTKPSVSTTSVPTTTQSTTVLGSTTVLQSTTTPPPTGTLRSTTSTVAIAATRVVLQPDGLGVVAFGVPKQAAVAALTAVLGPPDRMGKGCELAGPDVTTTGWKNLSVQFVNGQFTSYGVNPPTGANAPLNLATSAGIKLGSTVVALRKAYGSRVKIPGLPPEQFGGKDFQVSFPNTTKLIIGTLSATSNDGQVTGFFTSLCE